MELNTIDDPLFVEYVHIQKSLVRPGEKVSKGQVIGWSGSVGFSPEPHLHFCAYRSSEATAPTVRVYFESSKSEKFLPEAGKWYTSNAEGEAV
jgi:murein DD-endopeptidase MepM/ murein hydrolase activator NlpD